MHAARQLVVDVDQAGNVLRILEMEIESATDGGGKSGQFRYIVDGDADQWRGMTSCKYLITRTLSYRTACAHHIVLHVCILERRVAIEESIQRRPAHIEKSSGLGTVSSCAT